MKLVVVVGGSSGRGFIVGRPRRVLVHPTVDAPARVLAYQPSFTAKAIQIIYPNTAFTNLGILFLVDKLLLHECMDF